MMTEEQIILLTGVIAAHDGRILDETTEALWRRAAIKHRWDFDQCVEAVDAFFAEPLEKGQRRAWFDPGQMRRMLRTLRPGGSGPAPADMVLGESRRALTRGGRASESTRRQVMEQLRRRLPAGRVKARGPLWDPEQVRPDLEDDGGPVNVDQVRRQLRASTNAPQGLSRAF